MLMFIFLVVLLIIVIEKNSKLTKELKKQEKIISFCPKCGYDLYGKTQNFNVHSTNQMQSNIDMPKMNIIEKEQKELKNKMSEKEIKNNSILIVGSVLIILSSIIFLSSTWTITNEFIKLLILSLIFGVFLISSFVADKYLSLNKTSKIFFNIAVFYIPIILFSISLFELFGEYLSLNGEGKYIYLFGSSLLVSVIYYFISKKKESKLIANAGFIFQLISIIFLVNCFVNNFIVSLVGIIIHNVFYTMLYNNNMIYYNRELHYKTSKITAVSLSILSGYITLINLFNVGNIEYILFYIVLFIHSFYIYSYSLKRENIFDIVFPIIFTMTALNISGFMNNSFKYLQVLIIISNVLIYLINYLKNKKMPLVSCIYVSVISLLLWSYTTIGYSLLLNTVVVILSYVILNLIDYLINKNKFNMYSLVISSYILFSNIINVYELPEVLNLYLTIFVLLINIFNKYEIKTPIKLISIIYSIILFSNFTLFEIDNLYFMLSIPIYYIVMFVYNYLEKNELYKLVSYISMNVFIISLSSITNLDISNYAFLISLTIILLIEKYLLNNKSKMMNNFIFVEFIISYFLLNVDSSITNMILIFVSGLIYTFYVKQFDKNNNYYYLMYLSLIPYIYFNNSLFFKEIYINNNMIFDNYMYIVSLLVIGLFISLSYLKKDKLYYILFYIFMILHFFNLEINGYIGLVVSILGTYLIIKSNDKYNNDIFKFILYILSLILYKNIINDLNIGDIAILNYGIYILLIGLITRTIIKKYTNNYRVLEYISLSLLYLIALFNYSSELDGLIFVFLMVGVVIISYIYKLGPIFLMSLIGILLNVFILTRVFWFSIPWWIYILLVGIILVLFAVRNEVNEEKNKLKTKINDFKDKMDI